MNKTISTKRPPRQRKKWKHKKWQERKNSFAAPGPGVPKLCFKCAKYAPYEEFLNRVGKPRDVCKKCYDEGLARRKAQPKPKYAGTHSIRHSPVKIINTNTGEITEQPAYSREQLTAIKGKHTNSTPLGKTSGKLPIKKVKQK